MKDNQIDIAVIQETRTPNDTRETRKHYTWYFSGSNRTQAGYTDGAAIVIRKEWIQNIEDIEPTNDSLIHITLKGHMPIKIIGVHIPQAQRTTEDKENIYNKINTIASKHKNRELVLVMRDFNARIQKARNREEAQYIGPHTFDRHNTNIYSRGEGVQENRELFVELCRKHKLIASNTLFHKQEQHRATFREIGKGREEEMKRGNFEQLDYILIPKRWRNGIVDAAADGEANIDSDHYPVWAKIKIKLKRMPYKNNKPRKTYRECTTKEKQNWNEKFTKQLLRNTEENTTCQGQAGESKLEDPRPSGWLIQRTYRLAKKAGGKATQIGKLCHPNRKKNNCCAHYNNYTHLPSKPPTKRKVPFSTNTEAILEQRGNAARDKDTQKFMRLDKQFRKSKRNDKRDYILETIQKDLDIRDRWMGIKRLRSTYTPQPYHRTTGERKHIHGSQRAQEAANYLSQKQWGKNNQFLEGTRDKRTIVQKTENEYNAQDITLAELEAAIRRVKRHEAAGPDEIPMESYKEMNADNKNKVLQILKKWWNNEDMPEEMLRARVVMIYKKGDTNKYANYRPISLLNSMYKLFATVLQKRIADKLDRQLQETQYGFRAKRGTADAIYLVRRMMEYGEKTTNPLHLVLLDWEKAFDKVDRQGLFEALDRLGVHAKLIQLVKMLYKNTQFKVVIDGNTSKWETQETGIRQGCPLSPYLFLVVMTAMFRDIHFNMREGMAKIQNTGSNFR